MATTTFEGRSVVSGGTWKALDGAHLTDKVIFTIQPEGDVTVTTLKGVVPGTTGVYDFKASRNLTTLKAGLCYFAGDNAWFTEVQFAGADVLLHE